MNQTAEVTTNDPAFLTDALPAPRPAGKHYALLVNTGAKDVFSYHYYGDCKQYKEALFKAVTENGFGNVIGFDVRSAAKFTINLETI